MQFLTVAEAATDPTPTYIGPYAQKVGRQWLRNLAGLMELNYWNKDGEGG